MCGGANTGHGGCSDSSDVKNRRDSRMLKGLIVSIKTRPSDKLRITASEGERTWHGCIEAHADATFAKRMGGTNRADLKTRKRSNRRNGVPIGKLRIGVKASGSETDVCGKNPRTRGGVAVRERNCLSGQHDIS